MEVGSFVSNAVSPFRYSFDSVAIPLQPDTGQARFLDLIWVELGYVLPYHPSSKVGLYVRFVTC